MIENNKYLAQAIVKPEEAALDLNSFKLLPYCEQLTYLIENGTYLATRHFEEYKIITYHLPAFFAEVWYDSKSTEISGIRAFDCKD